MSAKRQAENHLGPDNWDQEEAAEPEEDGGFKMAPKEVLEKRVIRTAKRRSLATGDVAPKPIFSGFSGFNKTQKPSFDFLANLTNGSKSNNESSTLKSDTASVSSSSMITKPASSPSSGIFSLSGTTTPITKSAFGQPTSESTIFGETGSTTAFTQSVFSSSKPDSTVNDSPFKGQSSVQSSTPFTNFAMKSNATSEKPISQVSSTLFGVPSANVNNNNSPFSTKTNNLTGFKTTVTSSPQSTEVNEPVKNSAVKDEKELVYYNNLKGLNESVSAWIKKHVEETPLCILTPIFRDYEKHLKNIQDEYEKSKEPLSKNISDTKEDNKVAKSPATSGNTLGSTLFSNNSASTNSVFSSPSSKSSTLEKTSNFTFGINTPTTTSANNLATVATPSTGFSFGIKPSSTNTSSFVNNTTTSANNGSATSANTATPSTGFSFGIKPSNANTSPFATSTTTSANNGAPSTSPFTANTTSANNSSTPFSFGIGKPFAFNSNIKKSDEASNEGEDNEDEPPKVEYTPIAEDNSVYDKKCKVFVKKDGNFIDKGVGTLYIKKIEETGKYQLLVRANTSLGNVLINMILSSSLPIQRMGKNNVMMVCMPTPDSKPPPTSILLRVKTSEDADQLLDTLNKYKA
ncbi:nuclear pore complex protein Nup50 isoform X1 [Maniola jurtina]|uniref:nuclear pore complex protein Nup50 isoform X1 n=1 Tax=Maniola jurtina TaxID=191418 RepID=UPI001E685F19|nr:nuclear pore complex protein Nup50 isoform X1 [Maniola jurtina]